MVAAVEDIGAAVVARLEFEGLAVEEQPDGAYRTRYLALCRPGR